MVMNFSNNINPLLSITLLSHTRVVEIPGVHPAYSTFVEKNGGLYPTMTTITVTGKRLFRDENEIREFYSSYWPTGKLLMRTSLKVQPLRPKIIITRIIGEEFYETDKNYRVKRDGMIYSRVKNSLLIGRFSGNTLCVSEETPPTCEFTLGKIVDETSGIAYSIEGEIPVLQAEIQTGRSLVATREGIFVLDHWKNARKKKWKKHVLSTIFVNPLRNVDVSINNFFDVKYTYGDVAFTPSLENIYANREFAWAFHRKQDIFESFGVFL